MPVGSSRSAPTSRLSFKQLRRSAKLQYCHCLHICHSCCCLYACEGILLLPICMLISPFAARFHAGSSFCNSQIDNYQALPIITIEHMLLWRQSSQTVHHYMPLIVSCCISQNSCSKPKTVWYNVGLSDCYSLKLEPQRL